MISVTLLGWIFDYFSYPLGILVCLIVTFILWLVAGGLEKRAQVMRAAQTNSKRNSNGRV